MASHRSMILHGKEENAIPDLQLEDCVKMP
jgi:hypothetical protein